MISPSDKIIVASFSCLLVATCSFSQWHAFRPIHGDTDMSRIRRHTPTFGSDAMSHQYQAIAWNRQKRVYDLVWSLEPRSI